MALQKVDAVIAGVGAFALLTTVFGVYAYEDLAGEQKIAFPTAEQELTAQQGADGTPLAFTLPDNATAASLAVEVTFTGQSGQGGSAAITIDITGPDGFSRQFTDSITVPANSQGTAMTIDVAAFSWAQVPEARTADPAAVDETLHWDEPLTVTVTVDEVNDPLSPIPGGVVNYSFSATVTPTITVYSEAIERPDLETA